MGLLEEVDYKIVDVFLTDVIMYDERRELNSASKYLTQHIPSFFIKGEIKRLKYQLWGYCFPTNCSLFFYCLQLYNIGYICTLYGSVCTHL